MNDEPLNAPADDPHGPQHPDAGTAARRRVGTVVALVAVVVVVAALLFWQVTGSGPAGSPGGGSAVRAGRDTTGLTVFPPGDRPPAPTLTGRTLDGAGFDLDDLVGHVVVINVWGSWCGPCRLETPDLVRVANETVARGVRFVGIDTRDNQAAASSFVRSFKVPYPSVFDSDGRALLPFNSVVPTAAVPSTIVLDRDGNIAARVIGRVTYATLSGLLDDLTNPESSASSATAAANSFDRPEGDSR